MGLHGKLEADVEIKASADKFHEMIKSRLHQVPNACPDKIQACNLLQGDWGIEGTIISWNYVLDGKPAVSKEIIERIDDEKNLITFKVRWRSYGGLRDFQGYNSGKSKRRRKHTALDGRIREKARKRAESHNVLQFLGSACKAIDSYIV